MKCIKNLACAVGLVSMFLCVVPAKTASLLEAEEMGSIRGGECPTYCREYQCIPGSVACKCDYAKPGYNFYCDTHTPSVACNNIQKTNVLVTMCMAGESGGTCNVDNSSCGCGTREQCTCDSTKHECTTNTIGNADKYNFSKNCASGDCPDPYK